MASMRLNVFLHDLQYSLFGLSGSSGSIMAVFIAFAVQLGCTALDPDLEGMWLVGPGTELYKLLGLFIRPAGISTELGRLGSGSCSEVCL